MWDNYELTKDKECFILNQYLQIIREKRDLKKNLPLRKWWWVHLFVVGGRASRISGYQRGLTFSDFKPFEGLFALGQVFVFLPHLPPFVKYRETERERESGKRESYSYKRHWEKETEEVFVLLPIASSFVIYRKR